MRKALGRFITQVCTLNSHIVNVCSCSLAARLEYRRRWISALPAVTVVALW